MTDPIGIGASLVPVAGEQLAAFLNRNEVKNLLQLAAADVARTPGVPPDKVHLVRERIRRLGVEPDVMGAFSAMLDRATLAVGAFLGTEPHRIAYRSALDHHGLLTHPARTIQVASPREITVKQLSSRPLPTVLEPRETILVASEATGRARVSGAERALEDYTRIKHVMSYIDG